MEAEGTLQVIAEISIGFTGFAGIFGALGRRKLRPDNPSVWLPFWSTMELGLATLFAAVLPALPYQFGASDSLTWAIASTALVLVLVGHLVFMVPRILRADRAGSWIRLLPLDLPITACMLSVLLTQVLNALGIGLGQDAAGFLLGLYFLLVASGLNFVYLMYVLLLPDSRAA